MLLVASTTEKFTDRPKQKAKKQLKLFKSRLDDLDVNNLKKIIQLFDSNIDVDEQTEETARVKAIIDKDYLTTKDQDELAVAFLVRFVRDVKPPRNPLDRVRKLS